jgi:hypothetical protein
MTNIALAVKQDPGIVPLIKEFIFMGGSYEARGNATRTAEYNTSVLFVLGCVVFLCFVLFANTL